MTEKGIGQMSEERIFENEEREHLAFIEKYIKERLSETGTDLSSLRDYIYEQRRRTWEDFARASEHPEQNMIMDISKTNRKKTKEDAEPPCTEREIMVI